MNLQGYHLKETSQIIVNPVMSENKVSNHWHLSWCISMGKERKWMKKINVSVNDDNILILANYFQVQIKRKIYSFISGQKGIFFKV